MILVCCQARPAALTDAVLTATDSFLFHHTKASVASRYHMMSKPQLREYLSDMLPAKIGELPPQCTRAVLSQVADVLLDDYYGFCLLK